MDIKKTIQSILKKTPKVKLPYSCPDGFIVEKKENVIPHLIINKIVEEEALYVSDFDKIYKSVDEKIRPQLCIAFLERAIHLESDEAAFDDVQYTCSRIAAHGGNFLGKKDEATYIQFFKLLNKKSKEDDFSDEEVMLESIEKVVHNNTLSKSLTDELLKRYYHYDKVLKDSSHHISTDDQRPWALLGKLSGAIAPIEAIRNHLDKNFAVEPIEIYLNDDFPLSKNDPYFEEHLDIHKIFEEELQDYSMAYWKVKEQATHIKIFSSDKAKQKKYFMAILYRQVWEQFVKSHNSTFNEMITGLVRKSFPFTEKELIFVLKAIYAPGLRRLSQVSFFKNVEKHLKSNKLSTEMKSALDELLQSENAEDKLKIKIRDIYKKYSSEKEDAIVEPFLLDESDSFGPYINQQILTKHKKLSSKWYALLKHSYSANGGKPNQKFQTKAKVLVKDLGKKNLIVALQDWLIFLSNMEVTELNEYYSYFLDKKNNTIAKGLLWHFSLLKTNELDEILEKLIVSCFKKIPGIGPKAGAVGNACIYCIATRNSLDGVALLNRAHSKISQRNTKALIQKYINETAEELKIDVADLEDFSIQDFGLENGVKEIAFNDYTARLSFASFGKTKLEWFKPDGKQQKTIPSFVKKDFPDELKAIRADAKVIPKTLTIQRDRLDRSFIRKRIFPFEHFRKYYVEHGLMSFLTKKLIWTFSGGKSANRKGEQKHNVIWFNNQWQNIKGKAIKKIDNNTTVELWHPLESSTDEILQWRNFLQTHQIKQPLKQAYREVYILTDAEINTKIYSNRMAAHILKQHQFNALAGLRGWKYSLMGWYDDGIESQVCSLQIPQQNLRAEYWINEVNAEDAHNDTGIWDYVATDQVRFMKNEDHEVDLIDVPKLVFSEIMRDVDLFVGVASVGNDPAWGDNSGLPQYNNYWESYSFGDLTELAKTRKGILEKLLPRLKISKVASIDGKFLIVKGKVRTYKIHIGSTNILMEPNGQYLCIVPARGKSTSNDKLFIPFEGDKGFSILLSKAFMLAEDDKITDSTILSQING